MFQAVSEVKVEGAIECSEIAEGLREQRMLGSVCWGVATVRNGRGRPPDAPQPQTNAFSFVVGCGASRTPRPTVFVGDEMSLGGSLVEDGGLEPP